VDIAPIAKAIPAAKLASGVTASDVKTERRPGGIGEDILAAKFEKNGASSLATFAGEEAGAALSFLDFLGSSSGGFFLFIFPHETEIAAGRIAVGRISRQKQKGMSNPDDSLLDSQNSIFGDASQDVAEHDSNAMDIVEAVEDLNKDGSKSGSAPIRRNDSELIDITEEPEEKDDVQGLGFPAARIQRIMRKHPDKKKRFVKEAVHAVAIATVNLKTNFRPLIRTRTSALTKVSL
jgi:hypothetical protein